MEHVNKDGIHVYRATVTDSSRCEVFVTCLVASVQIAEVSSDLQSELGWDFFRSRSTASFTQSLPPSRLYILFPWS